MYSHVIFIHYINHDCHYYFPVYVDAYPAESTLEKESNRNTRPSSSKDNKLGLGWNKYDDILVFNTSDVSKQMHDTKFYLSRITYIPLWIE